MPLYININLNSNFRIHICVTALHTRPGVSDKFISDVRNSVQEILKDPDVPVEGKVMICFLLFYFFKYLMHFILQMALYGVAQSLPDRSIVKDFTCHFLDSMYYTPLENNPN